MKAGQGYLRFVLLVLVVWFAAIGIWMLLHRDPDCEPSITLRGVPFAIQWHECQLEKRREP